MSKQTAEAKKFMTVTQIAAMFEVNRKTVNDWISAGKFAGAYQPFEGKTAPWLIPVVEVEALKKERDQVAPDPAPRNT